MRELNARELTLVSGAGEQGRAGHESQFSSSSAPSDEIFNIQSLIGPCKRNCAVHHREANALAGNGAKPQVSCDFAE